MWFSRLTGEPCGVFSLNPIMYLKMKKGGSRSKDCHPGEELWIAVYAATSGDIQRVPAPTRPVLRHLSEFGLHPKVEKSRFFLVLSVTACAFRRSANYC